MEFLVELRGDSDRSDETLDRNFTKQDIAYIAAFLHTLTDPSAVAGNQEISVLIPPRDGGPNGNQLDGTDKDENPLE